MHLIYTFCSLLAFLSYLNSFEIKHIPNWPPFISQLVEFLLFVTSILILIESTSFYGTVTPKTRNRQERVLMQCFTITQDGRRFWLFGETRMHCMLLRLVSFCCWLSMFTQQVFLSWTFKAYMYVPLEFQDLSFSVWN